MNVGAGADSSATWHDTQVGVRMCSMGGPGGTPWHNGCPWFSKTRSPVPPFQADRRLPGGTGGDAMRLVHPG